MTFSRTNLASLFATSGIAAAILAAPAAAQTPAPAADAAPDATQLEEIVVTAQKRAENVQDVPITINAVTAAAAARAGATTTADIPALVPGITISRQTANPQVYIRGVGTQNVSTGAEGSNPVYLDGFYNPSLAGALFALNSVERIEVLKGPQGTLFGRNATGGAVNIITRDPSHTASVMASGGYGNYNTIDGAFYGTTGLTETIAADLALSVHRQGDGFGTNLFNGQDVNRLREYAVRSKILFEPTDQLRITLSGDYDETRNTLGFSLRLRDGVSALITHETAAPGFHDVRENVQPYGFQKSYGAQLRVAYDLGAANFISMSSFRNVEQNFNLDQEGSSFSLVNANFLSNTRAYTQELQLQSESSSPVQWIVGGFYLHNHAKSDPLTLTGAGLAAVGGTDVRDGRIKTKSIAGYAQATVPLGDKTDITAGARYTSDHKRLNFVRTFPALNRVTASTDDHTWNAFTWRLAASHHFTDRVMAYASVSRGFKSGEYGIYAFAPPVNPEKLTAYEAGLKTELLDRKLRANAAVFHYDYNNIQLNRIEAGTQVLLNAAKAKVTGLDLDLQLTAIPNLTLGAGASILFKHEYSSFPNAPGTRNNPAATGGNTAFAFDASGNEMIQSPDSTLNLNAAYVIPLGDKSNVLLAANYAYNDGFFWEPDHRVRQNAFGLLSGQIVYTLPSGNISVRLWGKNLTNRKYNLYVSTAINDVQAAAAPRTYGAAVDVKF